jgi:hypothetical protein
MCVIIQKPKDKVITEDNCRGAAMANQDGFGFMYYDKDADKIATNKGCIQDVGKIIKVMNLLSAYEVCYHFRIKTHGSICDEQCHPFRVTNKEEHGMDIYMMHNGCISGVTGEAGESDTQMFVNGTLRPLLKDNPKEIESVFFVPWIEEKIGAHNKLLFMYGQGKILRINQKNWDTHEGMNVSNKNFTYHGNYSCRTTGNYAGNASYNMHGESYTGYPGRQALAHDDKEHFLCGEPVHVGDSLFVTHKENEEYYYADAKVVSLNNFSMMVSLRDTAGIHRSISFFLREGESNYSHNDAGYQCIRMSRWVHSVDRSIQGLAKADAIAKATTIPNTDTKELVQEQLALTDLSEEALKKNPKPLVVLDLDTTKPSTSTSTESQLPSKTETKERVSCNVFHGSLVVDARNRWTGDCLENSLQPYQSGVTILDFENMDEQGRFTFMMSNPADAFAMLQDLTEKLVLEDIMDGTVTDGESTVNDAEDIEDKVDKQQQEDEEMLEREMWAAGMYH